MVILSFDIEEFDLPTEYGISISPERQIEISEKGLNNLLDLLESEKVPATFYSTVRFMEAVSPETRHRLVAGKDFEIASHGMHHGVMGKGDLPASKTALERLTGKDVTGFRMPRMMPVDMDELKVAGYLYDSSLNPAFIPGRYNNLSLPSVPFADRGGIIRLPGPVTPTLRIPLFWLGLHHYPLPLYKALCRLTLRKTDYLQLYFHPWEFADWTKEKDLSRVPFLIKRRIGFPMIKRLKSVIEDLKKEGVTFGTAAGECAKSTSLFYPTKHA